MFWQNFKKIHFADFETFKGGFSNFRPTFFVSTPLGQIKFTRSMDNYDLYQTKLEPIWRSRKEVIDTFKTRSTAVAVKPRSRANSVKERRLEAEQ
jgi:hypothetical protein